MFDHVKLNSWFIEERRELPWRNHPTPYMVWVSEIMLQQTQVAVVIPYFERWMEAFPTVEALASASLDEVIKLWEGLGYYSRARNLHTGARYVVDQLNGQIPSDPQSLRSIKGIGEYTAGAILSFAFHQRHPAVDGNVMRVLCRYFRIEGDVSKAKTQRQIKELAMEILPEEESWVTVEALIELGATICQRKPRCYLCPLKQKCRGYLEGKAENLPSKIQNGAIKKLFRAVVLIEHRGCLLVRQVDEGQIMSGLHEFPYFEVDQKGIEPWELTKRVEDLFQIKATTPFTLPEVTHSFTQFRVRLFPFYLQIKEFHLIEGFQWIKRSELVKKAFSSGHRRILRILIDDCN